MTTHTKPAEPSRREDIVNNGLVASEVPDLLNVETIGPEGIAELLAGADERSYRADELFAQFCGASMFIAAPFDFVYDYLSNVYALEEWTATLRNFRYVGGGVYCAVDAITPDTTIYMKFECHRQAGVIDHLCAWDQGQELWMRYHFRLLDGMTCLGRPGTIVNLLNAKHRYYDSTIPAPSHVEAGRKREDRMWVGEIWGAFHAAHTLELTNLKRILERRWNHR